MPDRFTRSLARIIALLRSES